MDGGGGSGGRRRQRTAGGGFMRCSKGEEDMWVSFPRIPMYAYTSSARFVYARRNSIPGTTWAEGEKDEKHCSQRCDLQ